MQCGKLAKSCLGCMISAIFVRWTLSRAKLRAYAFEFAIRPVVAPSSEATCGAETMYYFEFKGTAFLWHQVRMMVGVLFLVGAGRETPETVDWLLDVESNPRQPHYDMASELPLVLYDCGFEKRASTTI